MTIIRAIVIGAAGRMGGWILAAIHETADIHLGGAVERKDPPFLGRDAGEVAGIEKWDVPLVGSLDGSHWDQVRHLILPGMVLSLRYIAVWSRYMRSSMLNVIHADYIRTARSKGLRERAILVRHALKNALIPVVSVMALDLSHVFSGAVITETIFAWPGIGR